MKKEVSKSIVEVIKLNGMISENDLVEMFRISRNMLTRLLTPYINKHIIWAHQNGKGRGKKKYYHDYITPNIIIAPPKKSKAEYQKEYRILWVKNHPNYHPNYHKEWTKNNPNYHKEWIKDNPEKVKSNRVKYQSKQRKGSKIAKYTPTFLLTLFDIRCPLSINDICQMLNETLNERNKQYVRRWLKPLIKSGQIISSSNYRRQFYKA